MKIYDIISKKKKGEELGDAEIRFFVEKFTQGEIPEYQASALLMAICFQGMNERETVTLTDAMVNSGDKLDLTRFGNLSVDKHSTGGVGDKTSIIVAPIVAAVGGKVAKMSGRGLGHTGGTVDKLESIPGYKVSLSNEDFLNQVENIGLAVIGQSGNLTPADKKLYALRDVTATVDNISLITSSIMSKKIAAGSHNIVLDVKVGSGAFMKTAEQATMLANEMVKLGKACGRNVAALITNMDIPLGNAVGNSLEIIEAVKVLKGEINNDLREVSVSLATAMIQLVFSLSEEEAKIKVLDVLDSKVAYNKCLEWIKAQGGDTRYIENTDLFENAKFVFELKAEKSGYIISMDTEKIGLVSVDLGAGRKKADEIIDYSAGIIIEKKTGDYVKSGDILCRFYSNKKENFEIAVDKYISAVEIGNNKSDKPQLIYGKII